MTKKVILGLGMLLGIASFSNAQVTTGSSSGTLTGSNAGASSNHTSTGVYTSNEGANTTGSEPIEGSTTHGDNDIGTPPAYSGVNPTGTNHNSGGPVVGSPNGTITPTENTVGNAPGTHPIVGTGPGVLNSTSPSTTNTPNTGTVSETGIRVERPKARTNFGGATKTGTIAPNTSEGSVPAETAGPGINGTSGKTSNGVRTSETR